MKGRKKLPEEMKAQRGTLQRCRMEPPSISGDKLTDVLQCYNVSGFRDLGERGKAMFVSRCRQMIGLKILEPRHLPDVVLYCKLYEQFLIAEKELSARGMMVEKKNEAGEVIELKVNPAWKVFNDAQREMRSIGSNFGWTPVDAMKLKIEKEDPMKGLMNSLFSEYEDITDSESEQIQ